MIIADYHTHTYFSSDSNTEPEAQIQSALKKGLSYLCFTDHEDMDYCYPGEFQLDLPSYTASMEKLRNVRLEQKSVNNELKNTNMIPSLASALAQVANNQTQSSSDSDVAALLNNDKSASDNAPANLSSSPNIATTTSNNPEIQENSNTNGNVVVGIAKNNAPQDIDESLNTTQMPQNIESPNIQSLDDPSSSSKQNTDIDTQANNTQTNTSSQMNTIQSQTRDSTTTNATTENTSSQDNTESTAQNNANNGNTVGIVSGDDKERVVDLFL